MIKLKRQMLTEHQEQSSFMKWLYRFHHEVYELTYHIPNGRLSAREGSKYKALGAKSGVPDICVAFPVKHYHGLYIEFKRVDGGAGLSEAQEGWIYRLGCLNYCVGVANGFQEAKKILEDYINERT